MAVALLGGVAISPLRSSPSPFAIALRHRDPQLAAKRSGAREDHGGSIMPDALDDLKAWADLGAKTSTSDPGAGTVYPAKRGALPDQSATPPLRRPLPAAR